MVVDMLSELATGLGWGFIYVGVAWGLYAVAKRLRRYAVDYLTRAGRVTRQINHVITNAKEQMDAAAKARQRQKAASPFGDWWR